MNGLHVVAFLVGYLACAATFAIFSAAELRRDERPTTSKH